LISIHAVIYAYSDHQTCSWVDTMAINDLPETGDELTQPIYDQQTTNIAALVLTNNAVENKLCGDLTESISSARVARASFSVKDSEIKRVRDHIASTPASSFSSQFEKDSLLSGLSSMLNFGGGIGDVISQIGRFIDHTNMMIGNLPSIGGILNDAISLPTKLTSAIWDALPSSFPLQIPSFKLGLDKLPIPNFSGFSLPSFPSINFPSINFPAFPDVTKLSGISIPGIPNPLDALKAFSGSVLGPAFGGIGKLFSGSMKALTGGIAGLAGSVSGAIGSMVGALDIDIAGALDGLFTLPSLPSLPSLAEIGDMINLGGMMDGIKNIAGGMSSIIGSELGAISGMTCSLFSPGAACGGSPSVSSALATATGLVSMAKTKSSAKLLASTATSALAKQLPETLT